MIERWSQEEIDRYKFHDGIVRILADVEWDDVGIPTKWAGEEMFVCCECDKPVTLKDIRCKYMTSHCITVICDSAMDGDVFFLYRDALSTRWIHYGKTIGYA